MQNFSFYNPARLIFGKEMEDTVGIELSKLGRRVLLVYGAGTIKEIGLYDKVISSLKQQNMFVIELNGVQPNPRLNLVKEGIRICRENQLDVILSVGGGSTIDTGKAIAMGVPYDGDVWDFFDGKAEATQALPHGVVLTIPSAGSESSNSAVITNEDTWRKCSYMNEVLIPNFAILNPALTYSLSAYQTSCGASDILSHLLERYFTRVEHVDYVDRLLEVSIRTILDYTPLALDYPDDYDVRAEMMWVGSMANNELLNAGREGDWASHKMERQLSGLYDIAHGAGMAIIFPAWMRYVCYEDMDRFAQFAMRVMDIQLPLDDKERIVERGILKIEHFFRSIGLPTRLGEAGIPYDRIPEMAARCCEKGAFGNFKKLYKDDVIKIFEMAR